MIMSDQVHVAFLIAAIILIFGHFVLYWAILRDDPRLSTERGILLYHLISAILVTSIGLGILTFGTGGSLVGAALLAAVAFHGIYSLTFLELWTLSQISYSRDVLSLASRENVTRARAVATLSTVGDRKKADRLRSLLRLGLARRTGDAWTLSRRGLAAALILRLLLWLPDSRSHG
jgi:hypothetical protein